MHDQVIRWFKGTFPHPPTYQNILVKFKVKTNEYFLCIPYANQLTNCQPIKQDNLVVAVFDPGTKPCHSVYFTNGKALQSGIGTDNKYDVEILCQFKAKVRRYKKKKL
jgi:hypothetical protein